MRILTIVADLSVRGTQRAAQTFSLAYKRAGHPVAVLAHKGDGPRRQILEDHSIPVFVGGPQLEVALTASQRFKPDVIHIHRDGKFDPLETRILSIVRSNACVVLETNVFGRVDYSGAARLIDVHMHVSEFCLWRWGRRLGRLRREQVGVLMPNPLDTAVFQRQSPECRRLVRKRWGIPDFAYVCGHVGYKSSEPVFVGFQELAKKAPAAWLVCVDLRESMTHRLVKLPSTVRARVIQEAHASDDLELTRLYSAFDCLLHAPLLGETFGYVVAEALLCGVPVASLSRPHHDNGHLEVIGHGEGGLIAGSSEAFPAVVLELFRNARLREQVFHDGPPRIKRLFDADEVADRALRVAGYACNHRDKHDLQRILERDASLQTSVDDRTIMSLLSRTIGAPNPREMALMHLVASASGQRIVRILRHRELIALRP